VKPALTPWLRPAQGFIDLRMFQAAWKTLDDLEPSARAHPETSMLRLEILLAQDKWDEAAALGAGYCQDWPTQGDFFQKTAKVLIKLADYEKALFLLRSAPRSLQQEEEYHYTVASCACRAGRLEEAKAALGECFKRDGSSCFWHMAMTDPIFEPIRQSIERP
jgi:tetratricopeptide (TPR) repeat protein